MYTICTQMAFIHSLYTYLYTICTHTYTSTICTPFVHNCRLYTICTHLKKIAKKENSKGMNVPIPSYINQQYSNSQLPITSKVISDTCCTSLVFSCLSVHCSFWPTSFHSLLASGHASHADNHQSSGAFYGAQLLLMESPYCNIDHTSSEHNHNLH